jgi:hypothetical protein
MTIFLVFMMAVVSAFSVINFLAGKYFMAAISAGAVIAAALAIAHRIDVLTKIIAKGKREAK